MNECFQFLRGLLCLLQDSFVLLPLYPVISQNSTVQVTMYKDSHLPFHVCVALYLVPSEQLYSKVYCDLHVMRCSIRWFIMFEMRMLLLLFQLWIFCVKYRSERRSSVSLGLSWGMHYFYRAGRHSLLIFPSFRPDCSDSAVVAVKIL